MKINIHKVYSRLGRSWREKRMNLFVKFIHPKRNDILLDVGGLPSTWTNGPQMLKRIDCLNIEKSDWKEIEDSNHHIIAIVGDACKLDYQDDTYDIIFSNSVIEHVGDWHRQKAFAHEVRRVGRKLWIQTPAYEGPLEPHFLMPFVHWLPVPMRKFCIRWISPMGWITNPSKEYIDKAVDFTRLLTKKQMESLFPDCQIVTERFLWIFPKSYIAYRI